MRRNHLLALLAAILLHAQFGMTGFAAPAPSPCTFTLGFATLHALIPQIVGDCRDDEHVDPATGDTLQATTHGLLVWRRADNWTAFTDGATTWINGPCGLQSRPNDQTLPWERGEPCAPLPPYPRDLPTALYPAWEALQATMVDSDAGQATAADIVAGWLSGSGARVTVAPLDGAWGVYNTRTNRVTISAEAASDLPAVAAAVLVHEVRHAYQQVFDPNPDCIHREVDAMEQESRAFDWMTGGGLARPTSLLQRQENAQLTIEKTAGKAGLYTWVTQDPGYQDECDLG